MTLLKADYIYFFIYLTILFTLFGLSTFVSLLNVSFRGIILLEIFTFELLLVYLTNVLFVRRSEKKISSNMKQYQN